MHLYLEKGYLWELRLELQLRPNKDFHWKKKKLTSTQNVFKTFR